MNPVRNLKKLNHYFLMKGLIYEVILQIKEKEDF